MVLTIWIQFWLKLIVAKEALSTLDAVEDLVAVPGFSLKVHNNGQSATGLPFCRR